MRETRKILGREDIGVSATCARVPVYTGHSVSANVQTRDAAVAAGVPRAARGGARRLGRRRPGARALPDGARRRGPRRRAGRAHPPRPLARALPQPLDRRRQPAQGRGDQRGPGGRAARRSAVCCAPRAPSLEQRWEEEAAAWGAWVRRDVYPHYAPACFELVPPPGRATLDLGCGEGRVTRDLTARGHSAIGVDLSPTLVRMAAEADPGGDYRVAHASELPFDDDAFDLVVSYNVLMDVDELGAAIAEAARVLAPGGRLCACVTHPLNDAGRSRARCTRPGVTPVRDAPRSAIGVRMTFRGWTHSIEDHVARARVRGARAARPCTTAGARSSSARAGASCREV